MRFGLLADVHANLMALEAVLAELDRAPVDEVVVAGDLVGYGAHPNECVDRLRDREAVCVAGNHDLYVTERLVPRRVPSFVKDSVEWTSCRLRPDVRTHLAALPPLVIIGELVVAHGSLSDPERYTNTPALARRQLSRSRRLTPRPQTVVLGHTHRQWLSTREEGGFVPEGDHSLPRPATPHLINPGSVGQSRQAETQPRARFAVLDTESRIITFRCVPYDVEAARAALRHAGLPETHVHLLPKEDNVSGVRRRLMTLKRAAGR